MHLTGLCIHALHALPHDVTDQFMHLLHGLCCFDYDWDIPLCPATLILLGPNPQSSMIQAIKLGNFNNFCQQFVFVIS